MSARQPRPRVVTAAFWSWLVAAVLMIVGTVLITRPGASLWSGAEKTT